MRMVMMVLGFFSAAALACGNPSCGCGQGGGYGAGEGSLMETLTFALEQVGMEENSDIQTAIQLYQKEMRSAKSGIPSEAFIDGNFYPAVYAQKAPPARAMEAQIELFETIYMILDDEQKKLFPRVIAMYQHHMQFAPGAKGYRMCGVKGSRCGYRNDNRCGSPECPPVPRKRAVP